MKFETYEIAVIHIHQGLKVAFYVGQFTRDCGAADLYSPYGSSAEDELLQEMESANFNMQDWIDRH